MGKNKLLGAAATALAALTVGTAFAPQEAEAQATTKWSGAPRTQEEDRQFKVNGRIHYDIFSLDRDFENPATADQAYSGSFARRAFIGVEGRFTDDWRYNVKFDLSPGASGATDEVKLDDAYLEYAGEDYSIFIGQNNAISHLEDRTSSNYIPFIERSMMNQVSGYTKTFGIATLFSGGNWSLGGGVYTDSLNDTQPGLTNNSARETLRVQARGTWAPIYQRTPDGITLLHLGVTARHRDDGSATFNFGSFRPNTNSLSGVGSYSNSATAALDGEDTYGAEVAFQWNAFGATAEYMTFEGNSAGAATTDPSIDGGYVDLFWSPTGESRNYSASDGSFGRITPRASLGSDGIGHIMLGLRYEWMDASDTGVGAAQRGETTGFVGGVTWAPIGYVRFMLNYGQYEREIVGANNDVDDEVVSFRTQFDW